MAYYVIQASCSPLYENMRPDQRDLIYDLALSHISKPNGWPAAELYTLLAFTSSQRDTAQQRHMPERRGSQPVGWAIFPSSRRNYWDARIR